MLLIHEPSPRIPKGEIFGTCGLEGIKGSPAEPFEADLWLVWKFREGGE